MLSTSAARTRLIDLNYLGKPCRIAACVLGSADDVAIVDPGPSSTLAGLRAWLDAAGIGLEGVRAVLLTHIHLDHAGATGTLVRQNPSIRVFVHERGAGHLQNPGRLLESARRIYGSEMSRLWGDVVAVPPENLEPLTGGETIDVAGVALDVSYTPGHASHHLSFFDRATRIAFVGDTAGIRVANEPYILPVAPPPDIDLDRWYASLDRIRAWRPDRLFLTHFGLAEGVDAHLSELRSRLEEWSAAVRESLVSGEDVERSAARFASTTQTALQARVDSDLLDAYVDSAGLRDSWHGLARYWQKRAQ